MKIEFRNIFIKDIKKESKEIKEKIAKTIESIEIANSLSEISNIKKLNGHKSFYRIKIGDYRLGFAFINETVIFIRFLHRKEIYKFFP